MLNLLTTTFRTEYTLSITIPDPQPGNVQIANGLCTLHIGKINVLILCRKVSNSYLFVVGSIELFSLHTSLLRQSTEDI